MDANGNTPPQQDDPKELVTAAINEHGFLLKQAVRNQVENRLPNAGISQNHWQFVATEYPVTATDGSQTRIDILLNHHRSHGIHVCLECKRHNGRYKKWIFFDKGNLSYEQA